MKYYCKIREDDGMFIVEFPDLPNVLTYGNSLDNALEMAKEALDGVLASDFDHNHRIPEPKSTAGYPVEVDPKIAFALELRKARANRTQEEVAEKVGMTYQQYQRLENPQKTNPTLNTICKLQNALNYPFLRI